MNYKERLLNELEELSIRIDKLVSYINNVPNGQDITLEFNQLQAMSEYRYYLKERIHLLMNRGDNMKKKVFRERYRKTHNEIENIVKNAGKNNNKTKNIVKKDKKKVEK